MPDPELVRHVAATTGLTTGESQRLIDDVLAWHHEPVEDYIRRRHRELTLHGTRNTQAFEQIAGELRERVVAPPELSVRQIRRIIYG